jgi:hypothetical protein
MGDHKKDPKPVASTVAAGAPADDTGEGAKTDGGTNVPGVHTVAANNPKPQAVDPFDPKNLVLKQDFGMSTGVKKVITLIPVRKPNSSEFVRVHEDEQFQLQTAALIYKEDREEIYLVHPSLWAALPELIRPIALFLTINRQGVLTIWVVKLPGPDGRINPWNASAMDAIGRAKKNWVRVAANMSLGGYDVFEATGDLSPPAWPDLSMREVLATAFKANFITDLDHPVLKKLRGEA